MAEDRYTALTSGMNRKLLHTEFVKLKQPTFRDTVLELSNNMELGEFIRNWINENPENGLNIEYIKTKK